MSPRRPVGTVHAAAVRGEAIAAIILFGLVAHDLDA
jgi:hypothetical protein